MKKKTKKHKCYKVVYHPYNAKLPQSAVVRISVRYSTEFRTHTPPLLAAYGYYLTAFKTLRAAREFLQQLSYRQDYEIWETVGYEPQRVPFWRLDLPVVYEVYQGLFDPRTYSSIEGAYFGIYGWPKGTVMYKEIQLKRKIERLP